MRTSRLAACLAFLCLLPGGLTPGLTSPASAEDKTGSRLERLAVLKGGYPRVFFFRSPESGPRPGKSYEDWDREFSRLMGFVGKSVGEELTRLPDRNPSESHSRFKAAHPDQLVLLHFNGHARNPTWDNSRYFDGHWLYYEGSRVEGAVPAESGETVLRVANPSLFLTGIGRSGDRNDDIGLCQLDKNGHPDWSVSEQVQLLGIDSEAGTIRVRRGCFGTAPRAFESGRCYAAAHCFEGPWDDGPLVWNYNYSTNCPRDSEGKSCSDVLSGELAGLLSEKGPLAAFDGVEFDSALGECGDRAPGQPTVRQVDSNADGKGDDGFIGGMNRYGAGVVDFYSKLRSLLGDDRLILADAGERYQRGFGILNGVESEGWPVRNQQPL